MNGIVTHVSFLALIPLRATDNIWAVADIIESNKKRTDIVEECQRKPHSQVSIESKIVPASNLKRLLLLYLLESNKTASPTLLKHFLCFEFTFIR